MKKVLVLVAAALLISGTGFAVITGSAHDFQADSWGNGEICAPCHTPHNGDMLNDAPLWDHDITAATFTPYTGTGTLDATDVGQPSGVSKLCLSCHDGTVGLGAFGGATNTDFITGGALVGTDLSNDHPVAFTYDGTLVTADGELNDPTVGGIPALLFGIGNDQLECASCHDVHNTANIAGLLVMDNAASALCLTCHAK